MRSNAGWKEMITCTGKSVFQLHHPKHAPESMILEFASDPLQVRQFYISPKLLIIMGLKESNQLMIVNNLKC